jgi:autotransporter-associated beta strand protein
LIVNGGNQLTVDAAASTTAHVGGKITGAGRLLKRGSGVLELAASNNDYSGGTEVAAGTLVVQAVGAIPAGSALQIDAGARLVLPKDLTQSAATASLTAAAGPMAEVSGEPAALAATIQAASSPLPAAFLDCAAAPPPAAKPVSMASAQAIAQATGGPRRIETLRSLVNRRDGNILSSSPAAGSPAQDLLVAPAGVDRLAWLWGFEYLNAQDPPAGRNHTPRGDLAEVIPEGWL